MVNPGTGSATETARVAPRAASVAEAVPRVTVVGRAAAGARNGAASFIPPL
jgi:hypothetical protein